MPDTDLKPKDAPSPDPSEPTAEAVAYDAPNDTPSDNVPARGDILDLSIDIDEARHLKKDLEDLLEGVETAHLKAEVKAHISKLNSWAGRYVEGLDAAQQLSETGFDMLGEARAQISLQLDDYLRLEGEGGQVATPEQNRLIDELSRALRRIDRLSKAMEGQFTDTP